MPMYLGSFTGGLFNGAQSIFGLYKEYQGVKRQAELDDIADKRRAAREDEERNAPPAKLIEGTQDLRAPGSVPTATPAPTPASAPAPEAPEAPKPEAYPAAPMTEGEIAPSFRGQTHGPREPMEGGVPRRLYPWDPANAIGTQHIDLGHTTAPVSTAPPNMRTYDEPYGPYPAPAPPGQNTRAGRLSSSPPRESGGTATGLPARSAIPPRPEAAPEPAPAPSVTEPVGGYYGRGLGPQSPPIPAGQSGGPYIPPPQAVPASRQQQSGPTEPIPEPVMAPPELPPARTMSPNEPIPTRQRGGPYIPPPQREQRDLSSPAIGGPAIRGGLPLASAEPPSLGSRILRSINPVGSAHAEGVPQPAPPVGTVPANATVQIPPAQSAQSAQSAQPAQPTGITPAQPPAANAPAHSPPGPLAVAGTDGKVQQSEATPASLAPPVHPGAYQRARSAHPELLNLMHRAIQMENAEGTVSPEFMAATIERESKWVPSHDHGTGPNGQTTSAKGMVQIIDSTRRDMDPQGRLDWRDPLDNMRLGVRYYKHLANDRHLGANTIQTAFAYRAGEARLKDIAADGWEAYAARGAEQALQVHDVQIMFPGVQLTRELVPGGGDGHGTYDAMRGYQRAQAEGPDGLLRHLAETGPAGLGMTDRWRAYQSALEDHIIRSGHPEMAPMAQEWTAQMSQQGTVSNLIAADQALLSGNMRLAAQYLAKGHAFYPDGSYARFGADDKNNIWAYQVAEGSGTPLGKPIQITHDLLAKQIIALQNPQTYVKTLQEYQKKNADTEKSAAEADYYRQRPGIESDKRETQYEIARLRAQTAADAAAHRADKDALTEQHHKERTHEIDQEITKLYGDPTTSGDDVNPDDHARSARVFRLLRQPASMGGMGMEPTTAKLYADALSAGANPASTKRKFSLGTSQTADGRQIHGIKDADGKVIQALTPEFMELVRPLLGLAGSAPLRPGETPAAPVTPVTPGITPARPPAPAPSRGTPSRDTLQPGVDPYGVAGLNRMRQTQAA